MIWGSFGFPFLLRLLGGKMEFRNVAIILLAFFFLTACSDENTAKAPDVEKPKVALYSDFFLLDQQTTSKEEYLELVANYFNDIPDNLYSHQNPKWAVSFADKYLNEGYISNGQPPLDITKSINWGNIPDGDGNYTFRLNAMYMAEPLVFAYRETGNQEYFDAALAIHRDWIEQNILSITNENKYRWYDMATGLRTVQLSFLVFELLRLEANSDIVFYYLSALKVHLEHLTNPEELGALNHVMFQMSGIYALCNLIPNFNSCQEALIYADKEFIKSVEDQYNNEGMHMEHSPTYHNWGLEKLNSLSSTGWFPTSITDLVEKAKENIIWMYHPNGQMVMVGHSEQIPQERYIDYHDTVSYVLSNSTDGNKPQSNYRYFKDAGYVVLRSPWSELPFNEHSFIFFNGAFNTMSHKTNDDLTLSWSELGAPILIDSGKYAYDNSDRRRYVESFKAHNTIEIVGKKRAINESDIYGSAINTFLYNDNDKLGYISAEYVRREAKVTHKREVILQQREWLQINDSLLSNEGEHTYKQWLQLVPDAELVKQGISKLTFWLPTQQKFLHIDDLNTQAELSLAKGQEEPYLQGWHSKKLFEFEPNFSISFSLKGSTSKFSTLLRLSDYEKDELKTYIISSNSFCWTSQSSKGGYRVHESNINSCKQEDNSIISLKAIKSSFVAKQKQALVLEGIRPDGIIVKLTAKALKFTSVPRELSISEEGELYADKAGIYNLVIEYQGNEYELQIRVGIDSTNLYVPSFSAYHEDVWQAFITERKLHLRNSSYADWSIPENQTWNEDPYDNLSWQFIYQSTTWFHALLYGYDTYGNKDGIDYVHEQIFNWWESHKSTNSHTTMAWHEHATANRTVEWLYFYNQFFINDFTDEELALFEVIIRAHADELIKLIEGGKWDGHNHSFYHSLALYTISKTFSNFEESETWQAIALAQLDGLFTSMVDLDEGVSLEQSSAHHFNALYLFQEAQKLTAYFGDTLNNLNNDVILKMAEFGAFMKQPDEKLPAIGDTNYRHSASNWVINLVRDNLISSPNLDYLMTRGKEGEKPSFMQSFPKTGYHTFRIGYETESWTNDTHVFLDAAESQTIHGNNDALSWTYFSQGVPVLIDSAAPYSYGASKQEMRSNYFHHARGHNTVTFNKEDYKGDDSLQLIDYMEEEYFGYVIAERESGENRHQRQVIVLKTGDVLNVDAITSNVNSQIYWHVNPTASATYSKSDRLSKLSIDIEDKNFNLLIQTINGQSACEIVKGRPLTDEKGPMGWVSPKLDALIEAPVLECELNVIEVDPTIWVVSLITANNSSLKVIEQVGNKLELELNDEKVTITLSEKPVFH